MSKSYWTSFRRLTAMPAAVKTDVAAVKTDMTQIMMGMESLLERVPPK